jgi:parallel beta-helix repeat protein
LFSESDADGIIAGNQRNLTIKNNQFDYTYGGVYIVSVDNCTIYGNDIMPLHPGIVMRDARHCNVTNNDLLGRQDSGISLQEAASCMIIGNEVSQFDGYGISLDSLTTNCHLYENTLDHNGASNAFDDGSENQWDDGVTNGNSWSDYYGVGTYSIPGSAGSIDHYPSIVPEYISPEIDSPDNIEYTEGETGHVITWTPDDTYPALFEILRNGSTIDSGPWDGSAISVSVDGLFPGIHNYTLTVWDLTGNSESDTVLVTVIEASTTNTSSTTSTTTETNSPTTSVTIPYPTTTLPTTPTSPPLPPPYISTIIAVSLVITVGLILVIVAIFRRK